MYQQAFGERGDGERMERGGREEGEVVDRRDAHWRESIESERERERERDRKGEGERESKAETSTNLPGESDVTMFEVHTDREARSGGGGGAVEPRQNATVGQQAHGKGVNSRRTSLGLVTPEVSKKAGMLGEGNANTHTYAHTHTRSTAHALRKKALEKLTAVAKMATRLRKAAVGSSRG